MTHPAEPLRGDLERGIRLATDLKALKAGVLNALMALNFDASNEDGRVSRLENEATEIVRRLAIVERAIYRIVQLEDQVQDLQRQLRDLRRQGRDG